MKTAREVLAADKRAAHVFAEQTGVGRTRKLLERAERDLESRLARAVAGPGDASFTAAQLRATLAQVREVVFQLNTGLRGTALDVGAAAAEKAAESTARYLAARDREFLGVGAQPLALDEARMLEAALDGSRGSILRSLVGEKGKRGEGVLARYGAGVVEHFEKELQLGLVSRRSWDSMRTSIVDRSPFLQQAPASWAERIVRTEIMGSANRANYEATKEAHQQLGDVCKILVATFDDRTACLVGSTRVAGAVVRAVFRRPYEGPAARFVTEAGRDLTTTPNHPMLTRRGWVAAGKLRLGDELVCDGGHERTSAPRDEHVTGRPPTIGEVFESLLATGNRERRRGRDQDFHGDGSNRDIDVLRSHGELRLGRFAALTEPAAKQVLAPTDDVHFCVECGRLISPRTCADMVCFRTRAWCDPCIEQAPSDERLGDPEALAYAFDRFAFHVRMGDVVDRHAFAIARMVLAIGELSSSSFGVRSSFAACRDLLGNISAMNVESARHLGQRHSGSVQLDRLVDVQPTSISGHVFDLSTSEGYFTAEGIYTGNSDSYAVHGQIRASAQAFETWYGLMQHPPARPNDREIVVPHRVAWPIPKEFRWRDAGEIAARWRAEKRKGSPPPRPRMTTIPLSRFGKRR